MIYVLTGTNHALRADRLADICRTVSSDAIERIDGSTLTSQELYERLMAQSLFAIERCIILEDTSSSRDNWQLLGELAPTCAENLTLIIIEPQIDKRTKTYKILQKIATIEQFDMLSADGATRVMRWAQSYADARGASLSADQLRMLTERALVSSNQPNKLVYDQSSIARAIEALASCRQVTDEMIDAVMPAAPHANVFELFRCMIAAPDEARSMIKHLRHTEDPYMINALLIGQLQQFTALVLSNSSSTQVAADIGAHPFVLKKLEPLVRQCTREQAARIIEAFARADDRMKSSSIDPWHSIDLVAREIASICTT